MILKSEYFAFTTMVKKRGTIVSLVTIALLFLLNTIFRYWFGANNHLEGITLAENVVTRTLESTFTGLIFMLWILQSRVQLINSGYYRMLLASGWTRNRLTSFLLLDITGLLVLLLVLNFLMSVLVGFFWGVYPWHIIMATDWNSLLAHFQYLWIVGLLAGLIAFFRSAQALLIAVFVYWMLEGTIVNFIKKKLEFDAIEWMPVNTLQKIVGQEILTPLPLIMISIYSGLLIYGVYYMVQKRSF
ncbi:hypothetical protein EMN47_08175 [Prolixibacteraceae bacterium JC049]|nr:hypothetical protein [Prolixibacteraceae bacterium JC049]